MSVFWTPIRRRATLDGVGADTLINRAGERPCSCLSMANARVKRRTLVGVQGGKPCPSESLRSIKKTRPAKCQIDKAGGFSYNGFSGSDGNPNHEYMRDKLTYSP